MATKKEKLKRRNAFSLVGFKPTEVFSVVGGQREGKLGPVGTLYEGYVLSWGDEFKSLDIVSPATPKARWFPTRAYLPGARGSDTLLGTMYDSDPFHTGHADSNRGVALGADTIAVEDSVLKLQARPASIAEQVHFAATAVEFNGGVRSEMSSIVHGSGCIAYYPTDSEIILEWRCKHTAAAGNPDSWHPDLWSFSIGPTFNNDEWDFEANGDHLRYDSNLWTGGSFVGTFYGPQTIHDGEFHTLSFVLRNGGNTEFYRDGVLIATAVATDANTHARLAAPIMSSHVYSGTWSGNTYAKAQWDSDPNGAAMEIDWVRVWRRPTAKHYKPKKNIPDLNVSYLGSGEIVMPSVGSLWGDATVTEFLHVIPFEENEPGGSHTVGLALGAFPAGISYANRVLSVDFSGDGSGRTGRVHFALYGYKSDGSSCEPARFCVNRGPKILASSVIATSGEELSYDLYANTDVGRITPKTLSVTGLPMGFSFNSNTGLITGSSVIEATTPINVTCKNALGQEVSAAIDFIVGPAGVASFSEDFAVAGDLDTLPGWTFAGGVTNGIQAAAGVGRQNDASANGTAYLSPQLTAGVHFAQANLRNNASGGLAVRITNNLNYFLCRRSLGKANVAKCVSGVVTQIATITGTITAANVVKFVDAGANLEVYIDGILTAADTGSLSTASGPPASTREGLVGRSAIVADWLDNYSTGLQP